MPQASLRSDNVFCGPMRTNTGDGALLLPGGGGVDTRIFSPFSQFSSTSAIFPRFFLGLRVDSPPLCCLLSPLMLPTVSFFLISASSVRQDTRRNQTLQNFCKGAVAANLAAVRQFFPPVAVCMSWTFWRCSSRWEADEILGIEGWKRKFSQKKNVINCRNSGIFWKQIPLTPQRGFWPAPPPNPKKNPWLFSLMFTIHSPIPRRILLL